MYTGWEVKVRSLGWGGAVGKKLLLLLLLLGGGELEMRDWASSALWFRCCRARSS